MSVCRQSRRRRRGAARGGLGARQVPRLASHARTFQTSVSTPYLCTEVTTTNID